MDPSMESGNPMFRDSVGRGAPPLTDRDSMPLAHKSTKSLKPIPADTTLKKEDWEMIEDSLIPFQCTAILICLGAFSFIGLTIHALHAAPIKVDIGVTLMDGLGGGSVLLFILVIPCVIGTVQILLAIFFNMLAALESWQHVSIQDVIRHHLPEKMEHYAKRIPLTCTARKAYLLLMWIFLLIQFVASAVAYGVNEGVKIETNKGSDASGQQGLIRDILDYSAAIFNVCCASNGWSKQGFIPPCPPGTSTFNNCTLPLEQSTLQNRLCACYVISEDVYDRYESYVSHSRACNITTQAFVPIDSGQKIPGTTISIRSLIPPTANRIPVIGDMTTVYGCGTGYLRGMQWALVQWTTNELEPYFLAMLIISGLQIVFLIVGSTLVCRLKVNPSAHIGEDGNVEYGEAQPVKLPQGIRALFQTTNSPDARLLSPQLAMPSFRYRSRSGSGNKTPKLALSPSFNLNSAPSPEQQIAMGLSSPEMLKLAAKRTSTDPVHVNLASQSPELPQNQHPHKSAGSAQVVDIDGVI